MHPLRGVGNFPRVVDTLPAEVQNCNLANFQIEIVCGGFCFSYTAVLARATPRLRLRSSVLHAVKCSSNSAHLGA